MFAAIQEFVICRNCKNNINFYETSPRGLGFKIAARCGCGTRFINSGPMINSGFEINRRIVLVMRLLGVGLQGLNLFCNMMDIGKGMCQDTYSSIINHLYDAAKIVFDAMCLRVVQQERKENEKREKPCSNFTVSGDGSWKKRGFTSLYGVTTLIAHYSGKVIDFVVKSSVCKVCDRKNKNDENYIEWFKQHQQECSLNHVGSAGKMEVDAIKEMFSASEEKFGVRYLNYIGDGDSKTYKAILDLNPYGDDFPVTKSEKVILPIFEDLSREDLLQRCLGGHTQNANESFNATVWRLAPKHLNSGRKIIEIASYIAAGIFNEGYLSVLRIMDDVGLVIGSVCRNFASKQDENRTNAWKRRSRSFSRISRLIQKAKLQSENEMHEEAEGLLYGPGIAD